MSRYIDTDLAKEALTGWETDPTDEEIILTIDRIPTAAVVSKSEFEQLQEVNADLNESLRLAAEANKDLQAEVDRLRFNLKAVLDERAEDKAEVAREIFEEIGKLIIRRMIPDMALIDDRLITDIAELKKKYTEGKE